LQTGGKKLQLQTITENNFLIVRISGELDLLTAETFRNLIERELFQQKTKNLILNLEQVNFIDSSGLGVILGRYKRIREQGGVVAIVGAQPHVKRVLELSGILRIIGLYDSEEQAKVQSSTGKTV
jgi:stage II sporulation protein AA (anti-sigma F factor antagonist)